GRSGAEMSVSMSARALDFENFDDLFAGWVPVTVALNSLNRSMGLIDPYPFVLCAEVMEKLRFVHDLVRHWDSRAELRGQIIASWLGRRLAVALPCDRPANDAP